MHAMSRASNELTVYDGTHDLVSLLVRETSRPKLAACHVCRCKKRAADLDRKAMPSEPVILEEGAVQAGATLAYPGNLTLANLADFILLPTLVYQMAYPRTSIIRWRWLFM